MGSILATLALVSASLFSLTSAAPTCGNARTASITAVTHDDMLGKFQLHLDAELVSAMKKTAVLNLNGLPNNVPLVFEDGTIAAYIDGCNKVPWYLNLDSSNTTYYPVVWTTRKVKNTWNADFNSAIERQATPNAPASIVFMACPVNFQNAREDIQPPFSLYAFPLVAQPSAIPVPNCEFVSLWVDEASTTGN